VIWSVLFPFCIEQTGVSLEQVGTVVRTRWTTVVQRRTGHKILWPVRCWVRASLLIPFYWSTKTMVTK
jgi:hypothetical protein